MKRIGLLCKMMILSVLVFSQLTDHTMAANPVKQGFTALNTTAKAPVTVTVGDPAQPAELPAAILAAYNNGSKDITIKPGTYTLPASGRNIELLGWNDAAIHAKGVTIIFENTRNRPVLFKGCTNVQLDGAILQFAGISYTQGRIKAMGEDSKGKYVDWQIDAGYTTDITPAKTTYNVINQKTRLLRVGTGDSGAKESETMGNGLFRLRQVSGMMEGAQVNDWLVCRAKGGSTIIHMDNSKSCTVKQVTLLNSGFAAFFETGGDGGHHYLDCKVTRGPKPKGATEEQLVSCGADGFHSTGTKIGPTIERCVWDGVLLDDPIAIHGSLQKVIRTEGNKLILEKGNRANFVVNEPVRISSGDGFFGQGNCTAIRTLDAPESYLELTLDKALPVPANAKAGNPEHNGKNFKIIDCKLGNTRSRGILVKGDNGIIKGCTIEGCGMSAISIGPEYYWNEADYSWNVTVTGNTLRHNALRNNKYADGVIFVHGDGAIGNRNITISNNHFEENYSPYMMNIEWSDRVTVTNNTIDKPSPEKMVLPGYIINLLGVHNITLKGNTYSKPGLSFVQAVNIGKDVEGVKGNDATGIKEVATIKIATKKVK